MPRPPIVLLDVDGPLADFTGAYLDVVHSITGLRFEEHDVDRWSIAECPFFVEAAAHQGISVQQLRKAVEGYITSEGFCRSIRAKKEAVEAVREIVRMGAEVYVVTSPWHTSRTWMHERLHWVADHFPIPRNHIIQTGCKKRVHGDVFVDDKFSHVMEWSREWKDGTAILFDLPHSRQELHGSRRDVGSSVYRGDWDDIIAEVSNRFDTKEASFR